MHGSNIITGDDHSPQIRVSHYYADILASMTWCRDHFNVGVNFIRSSLKMYTTHISLKPMLALKSRRYL